MKLGLIADVRGSRAPLEAALALLAREGCDRIACLGSTAEGGDDDEAVLSLLRDVDALLLPSPHDQGESWAALPASAELAGLQLAHATPEDLPPSEVLWATASGIPPLRLAAERLGASRRQEACGEWFEAVAYLVPAEGEACRRLFLRSERCVVPEGSLLLCPGSVAMAPLWRRGGALMTWDEGSRELATFRFDGSGELAARPLRMMVYCEDFAPHRPDGDLLSGLEVEERTSADEIVAEVEAFGPDFVLLDYHLTGSFSGLDAVLALRPAGAELKVPVFTIAGNPADQGSMKDVGALGSIPFAYLKDVLTRHLRELVG